MHYTCTFTYVWPPFRVPLYRRGIMLTVIPANTSYFFGFVPFALLSTVCTTDYLLPHAAASCCLARASPRPRLQNPRPPHSYELGKRLAPPNMGALSDFTAGAVAQTLAGLLYNPIDVVSLLAQMICLKQ